MDRGVAPNSARQDAEHVLQDHTALRRRVPALHPEKPSTYAHIIAQLAKSPTLNMGRLPLQFGAIFAKIFAAIFPRCASMTTLKKEDEIELHENGSALRHLPRTTRSSILVGYADLAQSLGLSPAEMLKRVGLDTRCLVDSEFRISVNAAAQLLELSAIEASAFDFGLRLAEIRGVPDLGPLNLLLREEPNLRCALGSLERYFSVHSTGLSVRLLTQAGLPILVADFITAEPGPTKQSREMIVAGLFKFLLWLKGAQWRPKSICFSHAAPDSIKHHRRIFDCPISFDQDFDGIVLTEEDLRAPLAHADPMLRSHAERYLNSLVREDAAGFEETVRKLIAALLPIGRCSAATTAQRLGMDRSTLTRRLASSGQSYTSILQSVRTNLAAHRVGVGGSSLTSVADALGFSSLSAFSHWFQFTFGCSAREWRRRSITLSAVRPNRAVRIERNRAH